MFNENLKRQEEELKRVKDEIKLAKKEHIYGAYDIGETEEYTREYKGVNYVVKPESKRIIDDFDRAIGSVEASHRESLGYSTVRSYSGDTDTLDFTFMYPQDIVRIKLDGSIKNITLNSVNIRYSKIDSPSKINYVVNFTTDIVDGLVSFREFIHNNLDTIDSVKINGEMGKVYRITLERLCTSNGINLVPNEDTYKTGGKAK